MAEPSPGPRALTVVLAGGGTAGHVNPLLATAAELSSRGHRVLALGTEEGLETDLVPRAGVELVTIPRVPFPRRPNMAALRFPSTFMRAVSAAEDAILAVGADAVVGFGGFVSTPAYLGARRAGVPIVVHEANARPGLANKVGARMTAHVAVTFAGTPLRNASLTGLPLRPEVAALAQTLSDPELAAPARRSARVAVGWDDERPVLVVTGGSLGAASLNAATVGAVRSLVEQGVRVWHLTGRDKSPEAVAARRALPEDLREAYRVDEYSHDMAGTLAAADAVVCRAGAATVSELTALRLPAVYVPLPHGNGEQALNASDPVEAGAARLVPDADLTPERLESEALGVLSGPVHDAMVEAAGELGIVDGAARLADMIEEASA